MTNKIYQMQHRNETYKQNVYKRSSIRNPRKLKYGVMYSWHKDKGEGLSSLRIDAEIILSSSILSLLHDEKHNFLILSA